MAQAVQARAETAYRAARRPTLYFIGVTTGDSAIMKVFPRWARYLELEDAAIQGIDCKLHDEPNVYRRIVEFIGSDPLSLGALVTSHKIDMLSASRDLFDELDRHAELMAEISCISKRDGRLIGHAKDPIASGLALRAFVPEEYFGGTGTEAFAIGAGGASIALTSYLIQDRPAGTRLDRIVVSDRISQRLEAIRRIHRQIDPETQVEYRHCPSPKDNDSILGSLRPGSLIVNATGLGKDAPGSPITAAASFPELGIAWDLNYRGDLLFLEQARAQQEAKRLRIEDGWVYFLHGWRSVIAEVFHVEIPPAGPVFEELSRIAAEAR